MAEIDHRAVIGGVERHQFGMRRDPFEQGEGEFHHGLDIANAEGTPIKATADGVVMLASWQGGYGRLIAIDHGRGFRTYYGHNSKLLVKAGDHVKRVFEGSMAPHKETETGISFIITKSQKAELRQRGYTEEQIREMTPEDAHRVLGLIG